MNRRDVDMNGCLIGRSFGPRAALEQLEQTERGACNGDAVIARTCARDWPLLAEESPSR